MIERTEKHGTHSHHLVRPMSACALSCQHVPIGKLVNVAVPLNPRSATFAPLTACTLIRSAAVSVKVNATIPLSVMVNVTAAPTLLAHPDSDHRLLPCGRQRNRSDIVKQIHVHVVVVASFWKLPLIIPRAAQKTQLEGGRMIANGRSRCRSTSNIDDGACIPHNVGGWTTVCAGRTNAACAPYPGVTRPPTS
jgi:hypothetical protein